MSKIEYPTINLFIYNLTQSLGKNEAKILEAYKEYRLSLPNQLKQKFQDKAIVKPNSENVEILNFKYKLGTVPVDGSYSQVTIDDSDCFRYCCSYDTPIEITELPSIIAELKAEAILPELKDLDNQKENYLEPGKLSKGGYLGKTWMISGWVSDITDTTLENIAHDTYKSLISKEHQYQEKSEKFSEVTVFELWRGAAKWEGIEKDSHVLVIFYLNETNFAEGSKCYNAWRYLFYCRHKILWAYQQGRELKYKLLREFNSTLIQSDNLADKSLEELTRDLQNNSNTLTQYVKELNLLEIQQHTVETNQYNYERQYQEFFKNVDFLEEFNRIVVQKYKAQLEKDYVSLNPGLSILKNQTATIRGIVEIEQAKRDRHRERFIAMLGFGIGAASVTASVISPFIETIKERPLKNDKNQYIPAHAWLNFWDAFGISIIIGLLFGLIPLIFWGIKGLATSSHLRKQKRAR